MPVIMPTIRKMGAANFNVHYGTEAPGNTDKLWVKTHKSPSCLSVSGSDPKAPYVDTLTAALSAPIMEYAHAVVGNKLYVLGGYKFSGGSSYLNTIQVFDMENETMSVSNTKLPKGMYIMPCAVVGTVIYLFGWYGLGSSSDAILAFDTETELLSELSATVAGKYFAFQQVAAVGTTCYFFRQSSAWAFDTETNVFTSLTTPPSSVTNSNRNAFACGTDVYIFPGSDQASATEQIITKYDTLTDTYTPIPTSGVFNGEDGFSGAQLGGLLYLFGNREGTIYVFDTATEQIARSGLALPEPYYSTGAGAHGSKIYITGASSNTSKSVFCFETYYGLTVPNSTHIKASLTDNVFQLASGDTSVELGVESVHIYDATGSAEQAEAYLYDETTSAWKPI